MHWEIPYEQKYMYRMKKKPPKMEANDCILQYKQTNDERYLQYFLHFYEPALNTRTESFCEQYGQLHHFQDIKQTIATTMLAQLDKYNPDAGANLITFTNRHVESAVHDYIRQNCGVICPSEYDYDNLRGVMFAYHDNPKATETERLQAAADKTGLKEDGVRYHLQRGDFFRCSESLTGERRDGDEDYMQLIERIGNSYDIPERLVLKKLFRKALVSVIDALPFKEKLLILDYFGLVRYKDRFREIPPLSKVELAARLHVGKAQSVDDNVRRAVAVVRDELAKRGWHYKDFVSRFPKGRVGGKRLFRYDDR